MNNNKTLKRRNVRRFICWIYSIILIVIMFSGFLIADKNIRKTSFADNSSPFKLHKLSPYLYEFYIAGSKNHYIIDFSFLSLLF